MPSHILKNILILPSVFERWGRRGVGPCRLTCLSAAGRADPLGYRTCYPLVREVSG